MIREIMDRKLKNYFLVTVIDTHGNRIEFNQIKIIFPGRQPYKEREKNFNRVEIISCKLGERLKLSYHDNFGRLGLITQEGIVEKISGSLMP
jgi:hypothetical protein